MPFLYEFGLKLAMEDVCGVITTITGSGMRRKVFVEGRFPGGPLTAYFAGWDFEGDPTTLEDAGFMNCAGVVRLDTSLRTSLPAADPDLSMLSGILFVKNGDD